MEIYFSPELVNEHTQILNIVNEKQSAVGFLCFLKDEKKMYVFGNLEEIGVKEDYKDLLKPYIQGMSKMEKELDVLSYITVGGELLDLNNKNQDEN
ncbi:hypothetical protein [Pueribacillus sp. YX66]|uniref:hypothetical protein n=1 Tax=Pueribacillus sp. YX66 TaxID=3229242 RepID=UPI00358D9766